MFFSFLRHQQILLYKIPAYRALPKCLYGQYAPDRQVLPSTSYTTSKADGAVILRVTKKGPASRKPVSVYSLFNHIASNYGDNLALSIKRDDIWKSWTYNEYFLQANTLAKAFIKLGLDRFHGVCIMGFNSPEWVIGYYAAVFSGGLAAGIYTTNSQDACRHLALNCEAQIILVEDKECLDKFLSIKRFLPNVKAIIQWSGIPEPGILSWSEAMAIGKYENDDKLNERLSLLSINQCCAVIYTSGTTGHPKGVMLSHDNFTWATETLMEAFDIKRGVEVCCSYLPLSHVAAQIFDLHGPMSCAAKVCFADKDALQGNLGQSLQDIQPTGFLGVPRVWEKMHEKILEAASTSGKLKKAIGGWAKYHVYNYYHAMENELMLTTGEKMKTQAANSLVIKKVKNAIGLGKCTNYLTGAAPLSVEIVDFFKGLGMPIMDCYGMSECMAMATINFCAPGKFRVGSVGKAAPAITLKLLNVGKYAEGEGEICLTGRSVCMGYLKLPKVTNESIDEEGWLHSGDMGYIDDDGFLFVTGRLKELIITAGGENVPPILIEAEVKRQIPCVSNCMLIGDRRKYLTILLTLKSEVDPITMEPLQELTKSCKKWMSAIDCSAKTVPEAIQDVKSNDQGSLSNAINKGIAGYNSLALSNAQRIQKWTILPNDFSVPTGEFSSSLKLKRSAVLKKYSELVESMYD